MCNGTNRDGKPCGNKAGKGTDHVGTGNCRSHCGNTANGRRSAAAQQAKIALTSLDASPIGDPVAQLALVAGQILAWRDAMADQVNNLTSLRYESYGEGSSGEQLRAEVSLWERALDRCERVLIAMAKLNIEERFAKISEEKARLIAAAVKAGLAEQGWDLETQDRAAKSVGRHLRAV